MFSEVSWPSLLNKGKDWLQLGWTETEYWTVIALFSFREYSRYWQCYSISVGWFTLTFAALWKGPRWSEYINEDAQIDTETESYQKENLNLRINSTKLQEGPQTQKHGNEQTFKQKINTEVIVTSNPMTQNNQRNIINENILLLSYIWF